jgi:hypothetical protein
VSKQGGGVKRSRSLCWICFHLVSLYIFVNSDWASYSFKGPLICAVDAVLVFWICNLDVWPVFCCAAYLFKCSRVSLDFPFLSGVLVLASNNHTYEERSGSSANPSEDLSETSQTKSWRGLLLFCVWVIEIIGDVKRETTLLLHGILYMHGHGQYLTRSPGKCLEDFSVCVLCMIHSVSQQSKQALARSSWKDLKDRLFR